MPTVEILIPNNPNTSPTTITTKGFKGGGCKSITASLEKSFGIVQSDQPTEEMYETPLNQDETQLQ